jgi:type II secretory pathway pseudopilin PulG
MVTAHISRRSAQAHRAFTLIELIVITAIIGIITTVILANNNRFGGVVLLQNLTYDVALSIRQAQVYGISGISSTRYGSATFSTGYGVNFNLGSPTAYTSFADLSANGMYDCANPGGAGCELISAQSIGLGYHIQGLCATPAQGTETCDGISKVDVLFKRPEPDAWISINGSSCVSQSASCQESARIKLESPKGDSMSVIVAANGQISVVK